MIADRDLKRRIILLSCAAFASAGGARIADPLIPQLSQAFEVSVATAAWAVSGFALAYGFLQLAFGPLGDRYGKYRVISLAMMASVIGGLGAAIAPSFELLVICRVLTGATTAAAIPLSMAWIADNVPYERRQPVLAYFLTGQLVGIIGGQVFGGLFADYTGWRGAFWFMLITYVVVGALLLREVRRSPDIDAAAHPDAAAQSYLSRLQAVFSRPWARIVLAVVHLEGALIFGSAAFIPTYLHHRFDVSLAHAGAVMGCFGLGGLTYTSSSRLMVQALGERGLAVGAGILLCASYVLLGLGPHWAFGIPAAWGIGMGYYMLHNTLQTNATQMVPEYRGTAVSIFASFLFIGQSLGVWLAAQISGHLGFGVVFGAAAVGLPVIGIGFAVLLKHRPH
jgi:predicted MFS family arabinose efflux permease